MFRLNSFFNIMARKEHIVYTTILGSIRTSLYSSAADIVSQERNRILPDKAEMLLFFKNKY